MHTNAPRAEHETGPVPRGSAAKIIKGFNIVNNTAPQYNTICFQYLAHVQHIKILSIDSRLFLILLSIYYLLYNIFHKTILYITS